MQLLLAKKSIHSRKNHANRWPFTVTEDIIQNVSIRDCVLELPTGAVAAEPGGDVDSFAAAPGRGERLLPVLHRVVDPDLVAVGPAGPFYGMRRRSVEHIDVYSCDMTRCKLFILRKVFSSVDRHYSYL